MLTLWAEQPESLCDDTLPVEVREPSDDAALERLLGDPGLLAPIVEHRRREVVATRRAVLTDGRPTIAMETYVRLMVLKQRYRWGYRTLHGEVSDSIHLRRLCRISLDSTVIEADVKYPTDAGIAAHGVRALAREGRKLAALVAEHKRRVRDRSRAMGRTLRAVTRTIRRRSGEAKSEVLICLNLTAKTGKLLEKSIAERPGGWRRSRSGGEGREGEAPRGGEAPGAGRVSDIP